MRWFKIFKIVVFVVSLALVVSSQSDDGSEDETGYGPQEKQVKEYLASVELKRSQKCGQTSTTNFNYETNVTKENEDIYNKAILDETEYGKQIQNEILANYSWWKDVKSKSLKKQMRFYSLNGPGNLTTDKVEKLVKMNSEMTSAFAKATVCDYTNKTKCDVHLEPDIIRVFKTSTNYDELLHYWTGWHDAMANAVPQSKYSEFVQLDNEQARANGFVDMGEATVDNYNEETDAWSFTKFKKDMADILEQIKPRYMQLHAFVRMKLKKFYGADKINDPKGYIPAHLFGNVWAQEWENIEKLAKPFPDVPGSDATDALKKKGYTVQRIFQDANDFYKGLGLQPMNDAFWKTSMFEKPKGRDVVCHAMAFDFCVRNQDKGKSGDYRIKMCTQVDQNNFVVAHHEMGHIEYYMHYSGQPFPFRNGANPGFHEAIGDTLGLSVTTPKHYQCILGLDMGADVDCQNNSTMNSTGQASKADLNLLFYRAISKFVFLPFAYSMEYWKWEVFAGITPPEKYNDRWWEIRKNFQGIIPPVTRSSGGFDPAAKFHIIADIEYIRYFFSNILMFQFFQSMCIEAGQYNPKDPNTKPLYQCDFTGSQNAGKKLAKLLSAGASKPWPDTLEAFTGYRVLSIEPLFNYYKPLFDYIEGELKTQGEKPCFGDSC